MKKEEEKSIMFLEFPPQFSNGLNSYANSRNPNFYSTSKVEPSFCCCIFWKGKQQYKINTI